VNIKCR